jgi:glycosyltransferase involved in cell wall biosynthesis
MKLLSILIRTVPSRVDTFLPAIIKQLLPQVEGRTDVELIYLGDNKVMPAGEKCNALMSIAKGKYVTFVDDDDRVAPNYVQRIIDGITFNPKAMPDVVCFNAEIRIDGSAPAPVFYSKNFGKDKNEPGKYLRIPNHLMCIRRDLAIQVGYKSINRGEDSDFAARLLPHLQVEHIIAETLYYYHFNSQTTETQK